MIRINLLPHRVEFRQHQILEHVIVFVAVVLLALALVITVNVLYTSSLDDLKAESSGLQQQNQVLIREIGELRNLDNLRQDVEGKLAIVDELQAGRFRSLQTLYTIADTMPENIWLERIVDKGGVLNITGMGESSKAVANFMRALPASKIFDDVTLLVTQEAKLNEISVRKFALNFRRLTLAEQESRAAQAADAQSEALP
ncbi:MAG: PilN domain-containing protein [Mariprofundaceae bacterium]|nr:PilN domain-containing protein [Mariprofundaceae bacterium]